MAFPSDLSRDSTSPEHMQLKAGQRVFNKRYELIEKIGTGGMGVVWLAQDHTEHTAVALKFLPTILVHHDKEMQRLREEVRIGKELHHQRIVATYGLEVESHLAAIVLEFVKGETLKQKLEAHARGFFEPEEIEPWLQDIVSALVYLHEEKQRLHRDLKPANLIVGPDGHARLMDFGISQTLQETMGRHTQSGAATGTSNTLAYASPESLGLRHKPAVTDDIYSLGATLYELLTGTPPFYQGSPEVMALHIKTEPVPNIAQRRAELVEDGMNNTVGAALPAAWQALVSACLAKDPAQRPRTAAAALHQLSAETPIAPRSGVRPAAERASPDIAPPSAGPGTAARRSSLLGGPPASPHRSSRLRSKPRLIAAVGLIGIIAGLAWWFSSPTLRTPTLTTTSSLSQASATTPYTNSLDMTFVPVPGTQVLFCQHEVRNADYAAYAAANSGVNSEWKEQAGSGKDQHPVVNVSWEDATAFCKWLSAKEGKAYRLPTDAEWSTAVGLGSETGRSPKEKDGQIPDVYPWGSTYPPGPRDGNYGSDTGTNDGYSGTAPVMQYNANQLGLYDLGGNVWEWCEDPYDSTGDARVLRGGSWADLNRDYLLSSYRLSYTPDGRYNDCGFRCVVGGGGSP